MVALLRSTALIATLGIGLAVGRLTVTGSGRRPEPRLGSSATDDPAPPSCWEATVYLSLPDGRGRAFTAEGWGWAPEILVTRFGGATLSEPQEGCRLNRQGHAWREPVRPVAVSFAPGRLGEFRRTLPDVGRRLGQEVLHVRFDDPRIELVPMAMARPEPGPLGTGNKPSTDVLSVMEKRAGD